MLDRVCGDEVPWMTGFGVGGGEATTCSVEFVLLPCSSCCLFLFCAFFKANLASICANFKCNVSNQS